MPVNRSPRTGSSWFGRLFGLVLFISALTGFAQLPIFKRYYIADIPGLGWLAEFYTTFTLHHVSAAVFLLVAAYAGTTYLLQDRRRFRLTAAGAVKSALLAAIAVTGGLLVLRNLPGDRFSPGMIFVLDMSHLGLVVLFLVVAAAGAFGKKNWMTLR